MSDLRFYDIINEAKSDIPDGTQLTDHKYTYDQVVAIIKQTEKSIGVDIKPALQNLIKLANNL